MATRAGMNVTILPHHDEMVHKLIWHIPKNVLTERELFKSNIFNIPFYKGAYWRLCYTASPTQDSIVFDIDITLFATDQQIEDITGKIYLTNGSKNFAGKFYGPASFQESGDKLNVRIEHCVREYPILNLRLCLEINCPDELYISRVEFGAKDSLNRHFSSLLFAKDFSDVIVEVEGQEILAHKIVLSARSSVFMAMFKSGMKEEQTSRVKITDIRYAVLKDMLEYAYTGRVANMVDLVDLMIAADKYNMRELFIRCREWLMRNFSVEIAPTVLIAADIVSDDILKTTVVDFIVLNMPEVTNSPHWNALAQNHPLLLDSIIKGICQYKYN